MSTERIELSRAFNVLAHLRAARYQGERHVAASRRNDTVLEGK